MLKGIDPLLTPGLLHALAAMGHGDTIAIVDANFPAAAMARQLIEVAGASAPEVLHAVLSVLPIDASATPPAFTMGVVGDPDAVPEPVADFAAVLTDHALWPGRPGESKVCVRQAADTREHKSRAAAPAAHGQFKSPAQILTWR